MQDKERIQELSYRLDQLIRQHKIFNDEIQRISKELQELKAAVPGSVSQPEQRESTPVVERPSVPVEIPARVPTPVRQPRTTKSKKAWEEFIGTNLLNKVGIAVLVLGVGFGAKYSIDHDLINPLTRIILGYLCGIALLTIAYTLRQRHTSFSAVLLSGGMAVLYFITFAAHSFYDLIPQVPTFVLMVMFTAFTVLAAVRYGLEVIGIIGLVGAYAVPLLLSDGSGRVVILFSYIAIINAGILFLAFRKSWKRLYYTAFVLTWLTFSSWFSFYFYDEELVAVSLIFSTIYLLTFYSIFLAYKLVGKEAFGRWDVVCMLFNSFLYFAYGYIAVTELDGGERYAGLFTVFTALLHFIAMLVIYRTKERSDDVFYFAAGMVLVFLTVAVPVQLEGNWVTIVWAAEATLLFWIGRRKSLPVYEKMSHPLMGLAFISLLHDWNREYEMILYAEDMERYPVFLNVRFLTSMLTAAAFTAIAMIHRKFRSSGAFTPGSGFYQITNIAVPVVAIVIVYTGFFKEIEAFWNHAYEASRIVMNDAHGGYVQYDYDLLHFKGVWLVIFSSVFAFSFYFLHTRLHSNISLVGSLVLNAIVLFAFITSGLLDISDLRSSYLEQDLAQYYERGIGHILIRYIGLISVLPLLWTNARLVGDKFFKDDIRRIEGLYFHFIVVGVLSSELVHWLEMWQMENSFKLAMSILWGAYALFMIVFGLSRDVKHIRIGGMVLFAVTLLKVFVYDMEDMSTILKTIVMIVLGALLLIASFIYNKYKRSAGNETQ